MIRWAETFLMICGWLSLNAIPSCETHWSTMGKHMRTSGIQSFHLVVFVEHLPHPLRADLPARFNLKLQQLVFSVLDWKSGGWTKSPVGKQAVCHYVSFPQIWCPVVFMFFCIGICRSKCWLIWDGRWGLVQACRWRIARICKQDSNSTLLVTHRNTKIQVRIPQTSTYIFIRSYFNTTPEQKGQDDGIPPNTCHLPDDISIDFPTFLLGHRTSALVKAGLEFGQTVDKKELLVSWRVFGLAVIWGNMLGRSSGPAK